MVDTTFLLWRIDVFFCFRDLNVSFYNYLSLCKEKLEIISGKIRAFDIP